MRRHGGPACLAPEALGLLMPLHLLIGSDSRIIGCGPTLRRLFLGRDLLGQMFFEHFAVRRPSGLHDMAALHDRAGVKLYLASPHLPGPGLRGIAVPLAAGQGVLLNLSFGIGVIEAVRDLQLSDADFAATDLAMELLYVVEAKSAVTEELRGLTLRLQGAKTQAEEQALTDTLTGLRNRRALDLALQTAIDGASPFGLMHLDLDFFKAVNDTLGHAAGDHVLRMVAGVLVEETRRSDVVARVGGDEFVILLNGTADPIRLEQIAGRIIQRLSEPIAFGAHRCRIAASVGLTVSTFYTPPVAAIMLEDADRALYAAKHAGRACLRSHAPPSDLARM